MSITTGWFHLLSPDLKHDKQFNQIKMKTLAVILLVIGLGLTIFTTVEYFTKEKIVDIGGLEITADKPHNVSWSPLIGIGIIAVGGILFWQSNKKN